MNQTVVIFLDCSDIAVYLIKKILANKKFDILFTVFSKSFKKGDEKKFNFLDKKKIFFYSEKKKQVLINKIKKIKPDLLFSYYDFKISKKILMNIKNAAVNFHPSYLPYNKGRHSTFWGIVNSTPLGASSHWMNDKFDSGDIFFQKKLKLSGLSTATKVFNKQMLLLKEVIDKVLKLCAKKKFLRKKQFKLKKSYNYKEDIIKMTRFNYNDQVNRIKFLRILHGTSIGQNGIYIFKNRKEHKLISKIQPFSINNYPNFIDKFPIYSNKEIRINDIFSNLFNYKKKFFTIKFKNKLYLVKSQIKN